MLVKIWIVTQHPKECSSTGMRLIWEFISDLKMNWLKIMNGSFIFFIFWYFFFQDDEWKFYLGMKKNDKEEDGGKKN